MEITMHISGGVVAFECQGALLEPLEKIVLNKETRLLTMVFRRDHREIELDCPIDEEAIPYMERSPLCGVGFYQQEEILGAVMVPLEAV